MGDMELYDLSELLGSEDRDFLIRNNGDRVKIDSLKGNKIVAIYFSPYCNFEIMPPLLIQLYHKIASSKGDDFEIVMVCVNCFDDDDYDFENQFDENFAKMPWLAVPYVDSKAVVKKFEIISRPWQLPILIFDKRGKVLIQNAEPVIMKFGAEAYPFTEERIDMLEKQDKVASLNQSIEFLLGDRLIVAASPEQYVPVSQLVGKTVILLLCYVFVARCDFTELLGRVYNKLKKDRGTEVEVVFVPANHGSDQHFYEVIETMPWLALPLRDQRANKLWYYFDENFLTYNSPVLVIIGPNGKTLTMDGYEIIMRYGSDAFPFTPEKLQFLDRKAKQQPWTLEYLLAFHDLDFLVRKDGSKVSVVELVGKTVMLYFLDYGYIQLSKIMESCCEIREKDEQFIVININISEGEMHEMDDWMLAMERYDVRVDRLLGMFNVEDVPRVIVLDSSCQILTKEGFELMCVHGGDAYPFTEDHLKRLEEKALEIARKWPKKILMPQMHQHEIHRVPCEYKDDSACDGCFLNRNRWNFVCTQCGGFDLHRDFYFFCNNRSIRPLDGRPLLQAVTTYTMDLKERDTQLYDLSELLGSKERDFLIRNNGDQVKISSLKGKKIVGIYFCAARYSEDMTLVLIQVYHKIALWKGDDFEIVMLYFVGDQESFNADFSEMPWLAVPHVDSMAVFKKLDFISGGLEIGIFDKRGKILIRSGNTTITKFGAEAYPFTEERVGVLEKQDKVASLNQSIEFLLGDHLITAASPEKYVPVSQLVGKTVILYLWDIRSQHGEFTELLVKVYNKLKKDQGNEVEIVLVPNYSGLHQDFYENIKTMPWLALPLRDHRANKLWMYFDEILTEGQPAVVIIGPNGKTLSVDGYKLIRNFDSDPFTPEKLQFQQWTLEYLMVLHELDFLIRKDGSKVPVVELVGKTILLHCTSSAPTSMMMESFHEIREKDEEFVVINIGICEISMKYMEDWMLAMKSDDVRADRLVEMFSVKNRRMGIVLDSSCQVLTKEGIELMCIHGGDAYPFTADHLERLEEKASETASNWPEKIFMPMIHQHEIHRVLCEDKDCNGECYGCFRYRNRWNFVCSQCRGFNLHSHFGFDDNDYPSLDGRPLMDAFTTNPEGDAYLTIMASPTFSY